jgi:chaperonin cofactor prefoldin
MEWQSIINVSIGAVFSVFGWFFRQLWDATQELKRDLTNIEISLPTNYVRKDEMNTRFDKIEAMIGKLFDKLNEKVDK